MQPAQLHHLLLLQILLWTPPLLHHLAEVVGEVSVGTVASPLAVVVAWEGLVYVCGGVGRKEGGHCGLLLA